MITGSVFIEIIIVITVGAVLALLGVLLYRKLRENESLKYEFITIIAHKFRTPLTQIKWSAEGLIGDEKDPYRRQALSDITSANESLIKLTGTLVELTDAANSGKSDYQFERTELCSLARSAMNAAKDQFHARNLFMSLSCAEPEVYVSVDRSRFEFVLSTIFENACAYSIAGREIAIAVTVDKKHAAVSVSDDGIGIDPKDMPNIFTKFYRTKQAQAMDTEGLGIALYMAKSIMKRHGGTVQAYSEGLNKGSTFSVILPRVK